MTPSRLPRPSANLVARGPKGRRHVLKILAGSGHLGITEAIMMAYGFSTATLVGMACDGFVTVVVDTVRVGDRTIKVRRARVTGGSARAGVSVAEAERAGFPPAGTHN